VDGGHQKAGLPPNDGFTAKARPSPLAVSQNERLAATPDPGREPNGALPPNEGLSAKEGLRRRVIP